MVLYKHTIFEMECSSSSIARYHSQQSASVWYAKISRLLGKTYLLTSSQRYQIDYHVTGLNILARANLHGSIEGAPKDQSSWLLTSS